MVDHNLPLSFSRPLYLSSLTHSLWESIITTKPQSWGHCSATNMSVLTIKSYPSLVLPTLLLTARTALLPWPEPTQTLVLTGRDTSIIVSSRLVA